MGKMKEKRAEEDVEWAKLERAQDMIDDMDDDWFGHEEIDDGDLEWQLDDVCENCGCAGDDLSFYDNGVMLCPECLMEDMAEEEDFE